MTDGVSILIGEKADKEEEKNKLLLLISLSCLYNMR
jgi:hypothetical protein